MYPSKSDQDFHSSTAPLYPTSSVQPQSYPTSQIATGYPFPPNAAQPQQQGPPTEWSTGLCDCCQDPFNCCLTCCCPCITFGQLAEIVDEGYTGCAVSGAIYGLLLYFTGFACCYSCFYRTKMRDKYNLAENPCGDCLVHCFCESCALCQEYREVKNRGFDPALGWEGYLRKQQRQQGMGIAMAPPSGQTMRKP